MGMIIEFTIIGSEKSKKSCGRFTLKARVSIRLIPQIKYFITKTINDFWNYIQSLSETKHKYLYKLYLKGSI